MYPEGLTEGKHPYFVYVCLRMLMNGCFIKLKYRVLYAYEENNIKTKSQTKK